MNGRALHTLAPNRRTWITAVLLLAFGLTPLAQLGLVHAAASDLDAAFDTDGIAILNHGGHDVIYDVTVQPDDKVVAVGTVGPTSSYDMGIARFNADGSLDAGFGTGGIVVLDFGGDENAAAVALQPDGKILAAGYATVAGDHRFRVSRLNADGTVDTGFGSSGTATTNFTGDDGVLALVVQPDGKIVAAGPAGGDYGLARYNSDGSPDTGFGSGGTVTTHINGYDAATALALQADGKLVAAGVSSGTPGTDFSAVRYLSDGTLDASFGTGGKVVTDFGYGEGANALALQANGKLVVAGDTGPPGLGDFALARYETDGSLDFGFGSGGKVTTDLGLNDSAWALVIQANGKIVVAGGRVPATVGADFALARYMTDGSPDATFDGDGWLATNVGGHDHALAAALQPDGKIVVAGYANGGPGSADDWALARYLGDPVVADIDGDGHVDAVDNCPLVPNPDQCDNDFDGDGDPCDADDDNDGVLDDVDNCPIAFNPSQTDTDDDGVGDVCDSDDDGDGSADGSDNCPLTSNASQADYDGDGSGDACDPDDDGDGVGDESDGCPLGSQAADVVVDGCATGVPNHVFAGGCGFNDLIAACASSAANHGQFVSCVSALSNEWTTAGLITGAQKGAIVSCAASSDLP